MLTRFRSMVAHQVLQRAGYNVSSYGTGSAVRLPGPSIDKPVVYSFGTPYNEMYNELQKRDERLYKNNGVLMMLDRNRTIKDHPERWHEKDMHKVFDVVFTCEERCFDAVCIDLMNRGAKLNRLVHVINIEIKDNHEEAVVGGNGILDLANMINESEDVDSEIMEIISKWEEAHKNLPILHQACFF
jgi:RNA polymerase II subunit A C-terminal domain phosphatase SSU72